jgi:hypothetical protein
MAGFRKVSFVMRLQWKAKTFVFSGLEPFTADLLRRLPGCATADDDVARARIFPSPTGGSDEETDCDWSENVEPELRELFASHIDTVAADLAHMKPDEEGETLSIPEKNAPAWIHTLNQARLALGERHGMTEQHLNFGEFPENQEDAFAVLQVEFYGQILSYFLRKTDL